MRWLVCTILAGALLLGNESAALANKVPCKKIKEAMASGKTAEQVATELGAKPMRVTHCMAGKKKDEKPAEAGQAPSGTKPPGKAAADDEEDGED